MPSDDDPTAQSRDPRDLDLTQAFGYPSRLTTEADGEHFREQRTLAVRRLKTGAATGRFDGLYLIGNSPVVLCEIKRYDAIDAPGDFEKAQKQLIDYARSEDFSEAPPFLVLYCGKPERTRFFVRKTVADPSLLGELEYDELEEIWSWKRVREFQLRGSFAEEIVTRDRLREILLYHLDRIEDSIRAQVAVAFDLAAEAFPLVFREDAYDYFRPEKDVLAELIYDLSTKSFRALTNQHVGDIYQGMLSARRTQQAKLGAFYTPRGDVDYMVSRLGLTAQSRVLDPCMGSGHFLEGIVTELRARHRELGVDETTAYDAIVANQIYGGDIDSFALSLAAIRLFLLGDESPSARPHLYVHDMLLHSPERAGKLFTEAERIVGVDPEVDDEGEIDRVEFDAVVGNPPYGARKPEYKKSCTSGSMPRAIAIPTRCSSRTGSSGSGRAAGSV